MLHNFIDKLTGDHHKDGSKKKIKGTVVLMKKDVLGYNDFLASAHDDLHEFVGQKVSFQLISEVNAGPANGLEGKVGEAAYLEDWITTNATTTLSAGDSAFKINFNWDEEVQTPGAFIIRNEHHSEFYLKTLTIEDVPGPGRIHFVCNSWVYPAEKYKKDRVFFANKAYLASDTPKPLRKCRQEELLSLRGDGKIELQEWDKSL